MCARLTVHVCIRMCVIASMCVCARLKERVRVRGCARARASTNRHRQSRESTGCVDSRHQGFFIQLEAESKVGSLPRAMPVVGALQGHVRSALGRSEQLWVLGGIGGG